MSTECFLCSDDGDLDEHHKLPQRHGGVRKEWNTVLLCRSCHRKVEQMFPPEFWHKAFNLYAGNLEREKELAELAEKDLPKCEHCGDYLTPEEVRGGAHHCG